MKRLYTLVLLALALVCLGIRPALADSDTKLSFHVDFPFIAGASALPAGTYSITADEDGRAFINSFRPSHGGVLLVRGSDKGPVSVHAEVHFIRHDGRYYLDTVSLPDGRTLQFSSPLTSRRQLLK